MIIDIDIPYLYVGLQIKGKFACLVCGPKIKYHRSKILRKGVFDEYRLFLSKNHRYWTTENKLFNGKQEDALKPWIMTPHLWKFQYNRNRQAGTYGPLYMNCYVFFYCVMVFTIIDIDFCNCFINFDWWCLSRSWRN